MAKRHIPALDGIRGLAILAVLAAHAQGIGNTRLFTSGPFLRPVLAAMTFGWAGVDLFFVLSGFLITGVLMQTRGAVNRRGSFYARRFLRIFPIYYLTLIVIFTASIQWEWLNTVIPRGWATRASYFAFVQNWAILWGGANLHLSILGHFWSLAVEEQFYLLWPFAVWNLSDRALLKLCVIGAACAFVLRIALVAHFGPHIWIHGLTPGRGEGLLVGSALGVLAAQGRISPRLLITMALAGLPLVASVVFLDHREFTDTDHGPYMYTIAVTGLGLVFGALVGSSQYRIPVFTRALTTRPLRALGKYSYGIYVYHIPIFMITEYLMQLGGFRFPLSNGQATLLALGMTAVSMAVAWLSYRWIEAPLLRLKRYFDPLLPAESGVRTYEQPALAPGVAHSAAS